MTSLFKGALRALAAVAVSIAVFAPTALASPPPLSDQTQDWQQAFGDEFNGLALDPTKWTTCYWWVGDTGCTNSSNGEQQWYTPANVIESNGTLKLRAQ